MRRRDFIKLIGGGAITNGTLRAAAATPSRAHIGFLSISSPDFDAPNLAAFRDGLEHLGYIENQNYDMDSRWSRGDMNSLAVLAQDLLRSNPKVVVASAISPTRALKRLAPTLPIVCPAFGDSFVPGLAASFAHPGGSVTGIASIVEGLAGKVAELALDAIPGTTKIGLLVNPAGASTPVNERQIQAVAQAHGVELRVETAAKPDDIDEALKRLGAEPVQAVIVPANGLVNARLKHLVELALSLRLPLFFAQSYGVELGGLASYGVDPTDNFRSAASYVDKILKGAAPGDLPIEFPTKLEFAINLKTARALGLNLAASLVDRADRVIE